MKKTYTFNINSIWNVNVPATDLSFVIDNPQKISQWWSAVFLQADVLGGDFYAQGGLKVKLRAKGILPLSFKFIARVFYNQSKQQLIVKTRGDFSGIGTINLVAVHNQKSQIHINWRTSVNNHLPYPLMLLFKPIFIANHHWAMRRGIQGLMTELELRNKPYNNTSRAC